MSKLQDIAIQALGRPASQPALEYEQRWYTWGDLRRVADEVTALIDGMGAAPDAPIAFIARNRPSAVGTLMGLIREGWPIRMVYPFQSPASLARSIDCLKPAVVLAMAEDDSEALRAIIRERGFAGIVLGLMDARVMPECERCKAHCGAASRSQEIHLLTSGTTGPPKPFAVSYELLAQQVVSAKMFAPPKQDDEREPPPVFMYFPLGNISGILTLPLLLSGQRVLLTDRFTLDAWRDYVRRYRPITLGIPPAGVQMVLDADVLPEELASIRWINTGAAPLDPATHRAFEDRYGIPIMLSYGATEFAGAAAMMTPDLHAQWGATKFGSVGRPLPGISVRVIDPVTGGALPAGAEGLLEVIASRLGPDWIRTSDIGIVDVDGFIFLRGRADGAIMRGGFKILPETIERALLLHEAISAAAVVGIPDRRLGEVPVAAVQLRSAAQVPTSSELEQHLRCHVLATHLPVDWRFVTDLPKNASFKIDRAAVKNMFIGDKASA
jgi:acyl-coenzyme A synthetase/AMP-(fatty) acid ligase